MSQTKSHWVSHYSKDWPWHLPANMASLYASYFAQTESTVLKQNTRDVYNGSCGHTINQTNGTKAGKVTKDWMRRATCGSCLVTQRQKRGIMSVIYMCLLCERVWSFAKRRLDIITLQMVASTDGKMVVFQTQKRSKVKTHECYTLSEWVKWEIKQHCKIILIGSTRIFKRKEKYPH